MALEDDIIEILRAGKPLKAKAIADKLGLPTKEVNSKLHGKLKQIVNQDNKYQWTLKVGSKSISTGTAISQKKQDHALAKLSNYYLECLSKDFDNGIDEWASGKYGKAYCQLLNLPTSENVIKVQYKDISSIKNKLKKERQGLTVSIGYPVLLTEHISKAGNPYYKVKPIIIQKLDEYSLSLSVISPLDDAPYLNLEAIKHLESLDENESMQEVIELNEELGFNNVDLPDIGEIAMRLESLKEGWNWREEIDPQNLSRKDLSEEKAVGVYNVCAVFVSEKSKYTQGLEKELDDLTKKNTKDYSKSILGKLINQETRPNNIKEKVLVEPLPMNEEQRDAILRGLQNDITVVTGPPGTGKSQIVSNLVVNAVKDGQKVLFASKNNKAVDVVLERVNGLSNHPVMLRLGNNQRQSELNKFLSGIISSKVTESTEIKYKEAERIHEDLTEKIKSLNTRQIDIIELRNKVDKAEQSIEGVRKDLGKDRFRKLYNTSLEQVDKLFITMNALEDLRDLNNRNHASFFQKLFWSFGNSTRQKATEEKLKSVRKDLNYLNVEYPLNISIVNLFSLMSILVEQYRSNYNQMMDLRKYRVMLQNLSSSDSLFELTQQEFTLRKSISENSNRFWQLWLQLLPERLSKQERKTIGDYITVLELIVRSDEEQRSAGRSVWAQYYKLLPQITNILSCWAVTSLSVRSKVPFESCFFDLVIIDEASQCDIASAIPLLYRAKRAVIIGDDKQLTHISSINKREDNQLLEKYDLVENFLVWSYASSSLFRLAASLCDRDDVVQLKDHHRSHADIISYSNKYFYDSSLRVATNYENLNIPKGEAAIRWIDIKGKVIRPASGGSLNNIEAEKVVDELERIVNTGYNGSIGVVTPFRAQANRIRDLVFSKQELYDRLLNKEFIVDTVHKFQGDERDIMIFSSVVSDGISQGSSGFLARNGNLFNVALTRARASLIVIGDQMWCFNSGISHFSKFAKHVKMLDEQRVVENNQIVEDCGPNFPPVSSGDIVSDWEKVLYEKLYEQGVKTLPQYKVDKYSLDLALFVGDKKLDIEVDGETYHRGWDGELLRRDKIRNNRLIELGWDVQRFWVYEIRDNMEVCISRIKKWIEKNS